MNSVKSSGPADRAELKAVVFALASCFVFIGFLVGIHRSAARNVRPTTKIRLCPPPPPAPPAPGITERPSDMNSRFRVVPSNFEGIDFGTRSYGTYRLSNAENRDLVLIDGKLREFGDSSNWFDLNDVYYTDLTGDGIPEAIVMLTHLECGQACDGGKSLLYVYSRHSRTSGLREILKYESGSGMNGCSLKSLTVKNGRMTLELFDHCPEPKASSILVIREALDLTQMEFSFNGKNLVAKRKTFLTVPNRNEVNYGVDVRITDDRTPESQEF